MTLRWMLFDWIVKFQCSECRKGHPAHYRRDTREYVHTVRNRGSGVTYHKLCEAMEFRKSPIGKWLSNG